MKLPPALFVAIFSILISSQSSVFAQSKKSNAQTFSSPHAYCTAVGTVDVPGASYRGPEYPKEIADAVWRHEGGQRSTVTADWRCDNGKVKACLQGANARRCRKLDVTTVPTPDMTAFCREAPNSDSIPMAVAGASAWDWRCRGRQAVPDQIDRTAVDSRGFFVSNWIVVQTLIRPKK